MPLVPRLFSSVDDLYEAAYTVLAETIRTASQTERTHPTAVLVPGGKSPVPLFDRVCAHPIAVSPQVYVGLTDERYVPRTHPDSNYRLAKPFFDALHLPTDRILAPDPELTLAQSAADWHAAFEEFFQKGGAIRLAFLGIGTDGHTCSLFTKEDVNSGAASWAIAVRRPTPPDRISVTPRLLSQIEKIVFLAVGYEKHEVVQLGLERPSDIVAFRAVAAAPNVEVWQAC